MTAKELAERLNGIEYPVRLNESLVAQAKASELVIVYGSSDDLMEFEGAINDEVGAYEGTTVRIDEQGLVPDFDSIEPNDKDALRDYFKRENGGKTIEALWCKEPGYSWTYKTDIPFVETFDVMDDGEKYCRGLVFYFHKQF